MGLTLLLCVVAGFTANCAGLNGSSSTGTDRVAISPSGPAVPANGTQAFTATVTKETNPTVTWTVNDIANGNAMVGTVASTGALTATYTAPASLPSPNTVTIGAAVPNHDISEPHKLHHPDARFSGLRTSAGALHGRFFGAVVPTMASRHHRNAGRGFYKALQISRYNSCRFRPFPTTCVRRLG